MSDRRAKARLDGLTGGIALGGLDLVLVMRLFPVAEDRLQFADGSTLGREPAVHFFRSDGNDAAVMTGGGDLGRWLVGNRGE